MREGFRFVSPVRVRYSEVDRQGIVYYSRYLEYVDVAHTEYFRAVGFEYRDLIERHGFDPSVVQATLEYKRPAHFDDILNVHARVVAVGRTSIRMEFQVARASDNEQVARAQIVYVNFDRDTQSSRPVPESIRRRIETFEGSTFPASV
jgi:acyl-CoA thioester hydrolase